MLGAKVQHIHNDESTEKWMLRWMCDHRRSDKSINDCIREKIQVAHVEDKMREARLR